MRQRFERQPQIHQRNIVIARDLDDDLIVLDGNIPHFQVAGECTQDRDYSAWIVS